MDLLFVDRPRHGDAQALARHLVASRRRALIPAHAYFEIVSAVLAERNNRKQPLTLVGKRDALFPFETVVVSIDLNFVEEYLTAALAQGIVIDIGGSDMIFGAIALKHKLVLVTEDGRLAKRAAAARIVVSDTKTFVTRFA